MKSIRTSGLIWLLGLGFVSCGQASVSTPVASPMLESTAQSPMVNASPEAVVPPSASPAVTASSVSEPTSNQQIAIADPSALLPLRPNDPACGELPAELRDRRLVQEVRTLRLGDTPETVAERVFVRPTIPLTYYTTPGWEHRSYTRWISKHKGRRTDVDLTFLHDRLSYVTASILENEGTPQETLCIWQHSSD